MEQFLIGQLFVMGPHGVDISKTQIVVKEVTCEW